MGLGQWAWGGGSPSLLPPEPPGAGQTVGNPQPSASYQVLPPRALPDTLLPTPGSRPTALAPAQAFRAPLLLNDCAKVSSTGPWTQRTRGPPGMRLLSAFTLSPTPCPPVPAPAGCCLSANDHRALPSWLAGATLCTLNAESCAGCPGLPAPPEISQGWWQERRCPALAFRDPTLDQVRGAQFPIWDRLWGLDLDWCCLISSGTLALPRVCD